MNARFSTSGGEICFRSLMASDAEALGRYFESLSSETRRRFAPHPLTFEHARWLSQRAPEVAYARFIAVDENGEVVAYFILNMERFPHEQERFLGYGVEISPLQDATFAPSVRDNWQDRKLASLLMPHLVQAARDLKRRRLILMGGVQADNHRAVQFYEKNGFQKMGEFRSEVLNFDMILDL